MSFRSSLVQFSALARGSKRVNLEDGGGGGVSESGSSVLSTLRHLPSSAVFCKSANIAQKWTIDSELRKSYDLLQTSSAMQEMDQLLRSCEFIHYITLLFHATF